MDFKEIYSNIMRYFPIGIQPEHPSYYEFDGMKAYKNLCANKFQGTLLEQWQKLVSLLEIHLTNEKTSWVSQNMSEYPCYAGYLLTKHQQDSITHFEELHIQVSLLSNYFVIFGLDRVNIRQSNLANTPKQTLSFEPILTVSPFGTYQSSFKVTEELIRKVFPEYELMCYSFYKQHLEGLYLPNGNIKNSLFGCIYQVFFTNLQISDFICRGDESYPNSKNVSYFSLPISE